MANLAYNTAAAGPGPALDPRNPDAHLDHGLRACEAGRWEEALSAFRRAACADFRRCEPWYWMGRVQECLGERAKAAYCYFMALELGRHSAAAAALSRLGYLGGAKSKGPAQGRQPSFCLLPNRS
jgi:tetratricopeptide (TPR) repeat protein